MDFYLNSVCTLWTYPVRSVFTRFSTQEKSTLFKTRICILIILAICGFHDEMIIYLPTSAPFYAEVRTR